MTTLPPRPIRAGFTLIETLVAVTILALAVGGPLYVADRAYVAAQISKDQLTASQLAQEGIEYVRTMRDLEVLYTLKNGGNPWSAFAYGSGGSPAGYFGSCESQDCTLDPTKPMGYNSSLVGCASPCAQPLYLTAGGAYTQATAGNAKTPYTRVVRGTFLGTNDLKVTSTVIWNNHGTNYSVTATDNLTPWQ